jgi:hypothetical protein
MKPIIISHRGNINGQDKERENNPKYILELLERKIFVEIDVWKRDNKFFLGHDKPQYEVNYDFLKNPFLYCHAKNTEALSFMLEDASIHCFWHDIDDHTVTSNGLIWQDHYRNLTSRTIVVDCSQSPDFSANCYGICCDNIPNYVE